MVDATWFVQIFRNEPYPPRTVFRTPAPAAEPEGLSAEALEKERQGARMLWAAALDALLRFPEAYEAVVAAMREARRKFQGLPEEPAVESG